MKYSQKWELFYFNVNNLRTTSYYIYIYLLFSLMESIQQPQKVNELDADTGDTIRSSISTLVATTQLHHEQDDDDRMLFNFFLSKYNTP